MKTALSDSRWTGTGWALALAATLVLLIPAVLPPVVGPGARALLHLAFDPLCHQLADRSFAVGGVPFAVCHRCTGIFAGLVLGVLLLPVLREQLPAFARRERVWLLAAVLPVLLDWGGDVLGLWANTVGTRVVTGLWFGLVAGLLFARALALRPVHGGAAAASA